MGQALLDRLKQTRPLPGPASEAAVNLLLAAAWLEGELSRALEPFELSNAQYNVLRILRGAPDGHPRCEIASRLIVRAPDVTRLVDRLVDRGLVTRGRGTGSDRRHSVARLTARGLALLERADRALDPPHDALADRLGPSRLASLSRLCEALWSAEGP